MVGPGAGDCYSAGNRGQRRGAASVGGHLDGPTLDASENGETNRGAALTNDGGPHIFRARVRVYQQFLKISNMIHQK